MGRRILQHESRRAALHRAPQEARAPKGRKNQCAARRKLLSQLAGRGNAVATRQLDIEQGHVWLRLQREGQDLVRPVGLGHDFDITLHCKEGLERPPNHSLILGDQNADHAGTRSAGALTWANGNVTLSRNPSCGKGSAVRVPPRSSTRSRSPRSPLPGCRGPPRPSSTTSTVARPSWLVMRIAQRFAWLCRMTFVTPSRTVQARTASTAGGSGAWSWWTWYSMPAAVRASCAPASSAASVGWRYPATASRTSRNAPRATFSISSTSWAARPGVFLINRPASSLFSAITDRLWPRGSCKSLANRSRSSPTASLAICSRASESWRLASSSNRPATAASPTMASLSTSPLACKAETPRRRSRIPPVSATTTISGTARRQRKAAPAITATHTTTVPYFGGVISVKLPIRRALRATANARKRWSGPARMRVQNQAQTAPLDTSSPSASALPSGLNGPLRITPIGYT